MELLFLLNKQIIKEEKEEEVKKQLLSDLFILIIIFEIRKKNREIERENKNKKCLIISNQLLFA